MTEEGIEIEVSAERRAMQRQDWQRPQLHKVAADLAEGSVGGTTDIQVLS